MTTFLLQGHRGARGLFPENTLQGFENTLRFGVRAIELDIATTADGIAVVTHDPSLNPDIARGPDGAWLPKPGPPVRHLTLAELHRYDVGRLRPGSRYAALFPQQVPCDGARIPTLAETLALLAPRGIVTDAELKTSPEHPELTIAPAAMADLVVAVAEAANALHLLTIRSFDWRGLAHLRRRRPEIPLVYLTSAHADPAIWWGGPTPADHGSIPAAVAAAGGPGCGWAPAHAELTEPLVAEAHALGLRVLPWTVNDPADMARLIAWGIDGLCTDRPDLAPKQRRL